MADFKKLPPGIACCASIACTIPVVVMGMAATWYVGPIALAIAKPYGGDLGASSSSSLALLALLLTHPHTRRLRDLGWHVDDHLPAVPLRRNPLLWPIGGARRAGGARAAWGLRIGRGTRRGRDTVCMSVEIAASHTALSVRRSLAAMSSESSPWRVALLAPAQLPD